MARAKRSASTTTRVGAIGAGSVAGELALLDGTVRTATTSSAEAPGSPARSDVPMPKWLGRPRYRRPLA